MNSMEHSTRKIVIQVLTVIFFACIIVFAYYRFKPYIEGPRIVEISLNEYTSTDMLAIVVSGTVRNTEEVYINSRNVKQGEGGTFTTHVALSPGDTIIEVRLRDPFDTERTYQYHVYSTGTNPMYRPTYQETLDAQTITDVLELEIEETPNQE